mmetsp:Transcript_18944/g.35336  ORF Transcript_18944/g.35336 Transcript_18944/m.35336 type:complete len:101 (-) Transcript_18944:661-963(-)
MLFLLSFYQAEEYSNQHLLLVIFAFATAERVVVFVTGARLHILSVHKSILQSQCVIVRTLSRPLSSFPVSVYHWPNSFSSVFQDDVMHDKMLSTLKVGDA